MFILGLLVGPALGLLAGHFATRATGSQRWSISLAIVVVLAVLLLVPAADLELRLGLLAGILLGLLLAITPPVISAAGGHSEASDSGVQSG